MTRSEKEIREMIENKEHVRKAFGLKTPPNDYEMSILKWCLEGESRYTIKELEKISLEVEWLNPSCCPDLKDFRKFMIPILKDKKKVDAILNG